VFISAPRPEVFAYLADPRNRPQWQASLSRVELLDPGAPHVGMRWVDHVRVGPAFELRITALEPDRLWAEVGSTGPFTAFGTLLFEDEARGGAVGTRVRCVARVRARGLVRPAGWPATALAGLLVRNDLARAARILGGR
jgi:uncharacterized protein YndB with AHSA1/START domain